MNDIIAISSILISALGYFIAVSIAAPILHSTNETSRKAGQQFLSLGFVYLALAVPSFNVLYRFTLYDWILYRIFLNIIVLVSIWTTWRLYKNLRGD